MSQAKHPVTVAASIRPGYQVAYVVTVDGKEIFSRGEVFAFRRIGHNRAEITLLHAKTGAMFTNTLKANSPVALVGVDLDPEKDAITKLLAQKLTETLKEQASDFYALMPIED